MRRESTAMLVTLSILGGFIAITLTALTSIGAVGIYVFGLPTCIAIVVFMGWSDVRERFSRKRPTRQAQKLRSSRSI